MSVAAGKAASVVDEESGVEFGEGGEGCAGLTPFSNHAKGLQIWQAVVW